MKAVICTKYGPPEVLQIREVKKPIPKAREILVKNHASTVHIGDTKIRRLEPGLGYWKDLFMKPLMRVGFGLRGPRKKILGMEIAGVVESVGNKVTRFKPGDEVFASTEFTMGAYAEYTCVKESDMIALKPESMDYGEAAALINGSLTALLVLRKAGLKAGQDVLVYGASGSVGTFAVQLAKHAGTNVTGVCSSANQQLVKSLGADNTIDYTKDDFTSFDQKYDLIFDAVGKIPSSKRKIALKAEGRFLNVLSDSTGIKLRVKDLEYLANLSVEGVLKVVIDRTYSLDEIIEAHHYVDKGHKKGHVVLSIIK